MVNTLYGTINIVKKVNNITDLLKRDVFFSIFVPKSLIFGARLAVENILF